MNIGDETHRDSDRRKQDALASGVGRQGVQEQGTGLWGYEKIKSHLLPGRPIYVVLRIPRSVHGSVTVQARKADAGRAVQCKLSSTTRSRR